MQEIPPKEFLRSNTGVRRSCKAGSENDTPEAGAGPEADQATIPVLPCQPASQSEKYGLPSGRLLFVPPDLILVIHILMYIESELIIPLPEPDTVPYQHITDLLGQSSGTVVYYADISQLQDLPGKELLTPERRANMARFHQHDDQVRCLAAGLLLRRYVSPREPLRGPYGRPYHPEGPYFNLSHSGRYVVLAVSDRVLGADIEQVRPWKEAVAKRCYLEPELDWLARQVDSLTAFYTLWTAKESIMKATGAGFHMPPESFRTFPDEAAGTDADGTDWYLHWFRLPDHVVCVATPDVQKEMKFVEADRTDLLH